MARLSLSVAPEVKMISFEVAPISLAMRSRACFDRLLGHPAEFVIAAGGVAVGLGEVGQHRLHNARIGARGGVVVHVDGQLQHSFRVLVTHFELLLMARLPASPGGTHSDSTPACGQMGSRDAGSAVTLLLGVGSGSRAVQLSRSTSRCAVDVVNKVRRWRDYLEGVMCADRVPACSRRSCRCDIRRPAWSAVQDRALRAACRKSAGPSRCMRPSRSAAQVPHRDQP